MQTNNQNSFEKLNKIIQEIECNPTQEEYLNFNQSKNYLERIAEVENSSITIFDFNKKTYTFHRHKFDAKLGLNFEGFDNISPDNYFKIMHPDDINFVVNTTSETFSFLKSQKIEHLKNFKLVFEYRLINSNGLAIRFLQQVVVFEQTKTGDLWLVLIINDVIPNINSSKKNERKLFNIKTKEICLFDSENDTDNNYKLTKREIEILGLISDGYKSKQISEKLFISINTVNNHRQNIIDKMKVETTQEAIEFARIFGIL